MIGTMASRAGLLLLATSIAIGGCSSVSMQAPPPRGPVSRPFTMPDPPVTVFARPEAPLRTIVVGPGETLDGIARQYGVSFQALAQINNIPTPYVIRVGQYLLLPPREPAVAQPAAVPVVQDRIVLRPPPGVAGRPQTFDIPAPTTVPSSPFGAPPRTSDVQSAPLPPLGGTAVAPSPMAAPPAEPRVAAVAPAPLPESATVEEAPIGRIPARVGRTFAWPLRGTIASDFGPKPGGLVNDGINISAPRGSSVRAAENGVVSYAGNELRGFGNLVLVRHADGWVSAYGHLDAIDVRTGAEVQRGQIVGRVGQTGNVATPQLHFELRRAGAAVNPRQFLAP